MAQIVVKAGHLCRTSASAGQVNTVFNTVGVFLFAQKLEESCFMESDLFRQLHDQLGMGEFCLRRSAVAFPDEGNGTGEVLCQSEGMVQSAHGGKLQGQFFSGCFCPVPGNGRFSDVKKAHTVDTVDDLKRFDSFGDKDVVLIILPFIGKFDGEDLEKCSFCLPPFSCRFSEPLNDQTAASGTFMSSFVLERKFVKSPLTVGQIDRFAPSAGGGTDNGQRQDLIQFFRFNDGKNTVFDRPLDHFANLSPPGILVGDLFCVQIAVITLPAQGIPGRVLETVICICNQIFCLRDRGSRFEKTPGGFPEIKGHAALIQSCARNTCRCKKCEDRQKAFFHSLFLLWLEFILSFWE